MLAPTDETLVIETPERVPLHFALASIGNRFLACAFDHTLQVVAIALVVVFFVWLGNAASYYEDLKNAPKWVVALMLVAVFLVWSSYFVLPLGLKMSCPSGSHRCGAINPHRQLRITTSRCSTGLCGVS